MIYEATVTFKSYDDKGKEKDNKEKYILDNKETFSEVEQLLMEEGGSLKDFDVTHIKRSKLKEIANARRSADDLIWIAELLDIFHDDEGNEELLKYKIAFYSQTYESANAFISEYATQGYDMKLVSLKLTDFVGVL